MKTKVFPIRADDELLGLIGRASKLTRLSKSEVTRQAIRLGAGELVRRYATPRRQLTDYRRTFKGLEIPSRRFPVRPRQ